MITILLIVLCMAIALPLLILTACGLIHFFENPKLETFVGIAVFGATSGIFLAIATILMGKL